MREEAKGEGPCVGEGKEYEVVKFVRSWADLGTHAISL